MSSIHEVESHWISRCYDLERQLAFYKRLYITALTRNKTCACKIDQDTDELLAPCAMHLDWRDASVEFALKDGKSNGA